MRRNALGVAATVAVVLALFAGAAAAWMGMLEARRQAELAQTRQQELEQVVRFQQSMLSGLDPQAVGTDIIGGLRQQYRESFGDAADADALNRRCQLRRHRRQRQCHPPGRDIIDRF